MWITTTNSNQNELCCSHSLARPMAFRWKVTSSQNHKNRIIFNWLPLFFCYGHEWKKILENMNTFFYHWCKLSFALCLIFYRNQYNVMILDSTYFNDSSSSNSTNALRCNVKKSFKNADITSYHETNSYSWIYVTAWNMSECLQKK